MLTLENIIIIIISYFIGCIPSALLMVKIFANKDVRNEGSSNVGAMNSYEITGSKFVGIIVFLMDAFKGLLAVLIASFLTDDNFQSLAIACAWVVIGHNFNVFLKFKGGKGLATATGAFLVINPLTIILWCIMWVTGYFIIKRDINSANITASILAPFLLISSPDRLISLFNVVEIPSLFQLKVLAVVVCLIILLKHRKDVKQMVNKNEE